MWSWNVTPSSTPWSMRDQCIRALDLDNRRWWGGQAISVFVCVCLNVFTPHFSAAASFLLISTVYLPKGVWIWKGVNGTLILLRFQLEPSRATSRAVAEAQSLTEHSQLAVPRGNGGINVKDGIKRGESRGWCVGGGSWVLAFLPLKLQDFICLREYIRQKQRDH